MDVLSLNYKTVFGFSNTRDQVKLVELLNRNEIVETQLQSWQKWSTYFQFHESSSIAHDNVRLHILGDFVRVIHNGRCKVQKDVIAVSLLFGAEQSYFQLIETLKDQPLPFVFQISK